MTLAWRASPVQPQGGASIPDRQQRRRPIHAMYQYTKVLALLIFNYVQLRSRTMVCAHVLRRLLLPRAVPNFTAAWGKSFHLSVTTLPTFSAVDITVYVYKMPEADGIFIHRSRTLTNA